MHISKEVKEYSDLEKNRKGKEKSGGVRGSKDSSEKQKLDSKVGKFSMGGLEMGTI